MALETTIDAAGRLVIPKAIRDRLRLRAGVKLRISEVDGNVILSPDRPEPGLVERGGYLVLDLGAEIGEADHRDGRDERIRDLVAQTSPPAATMRASRS